MAIPYTVRLLTNHYKSYTSLLAVLPAREIRPGWGKEAGLAMDQGDSGYLFGLVLLLQIVLRKRTNLIGQDFAIKIRGGSGHF